MIKKRVDYKIDLNISQSILHYWNRNTRHPIYLGASYSLISFPNTRLESIFHTTGTNSRAFSYTYQYMAYHKAIILRHRIVNISEISRERKYKSSYFHKYPASLFTLWTFSSKIIKCFTFQFRIFLIHTIFIGKDGFTFTLSPMQYA